MKKKQTQLIPFLIMMVVGGGVGFAAATLGMKWAKGLPPGQAAVLLMLIVPAFFLVISVHEAGHAFAGKIVKFDFRMYVVGPFMWDKEESGWKFKWNKNVNLSGGLVICLPTSTENLAKRFSIYALGGPLASLIFTAVTYSGQVAMLSINYDKLAGLSIVAFFFGTVSFLSFFIFIATIIPLHMNGFYTDGARALRFLRGGETSRFEILLMKIITSSTSGIRPRELNVEEVQEALWLAQKLNAPMGVYLHSYLFHIALDQGNFTEAEKHLTNYLAEIESIPKGMRGSVFLDAAFFYAYVLEDLSKAEEFWKQYVPSAILPKAQVLAAEVSISLLKREHVTADKKIDMALKELSNMIDRGVAKSLHDNLMNMKGRQGEVVGQVTLNGKPISVSI